MAVRERAEDGVRDSADPHLERRAVRDEARDVEADLPADVVRRLGSELEERLVDGDEVRDAVDVDERVAERARHLRVHFGEDERRRVHRGAHDVDRDPEAHEAVAVGRADLDEGDVDPDAPAT